jgi:hypothetical protein
VKKTWAQFKTHFAAAYSQHKQIQDESAATSGYHAANNDVGQTEEQMAEATIGALANLATTTAVDRGVVTTLTEANARHFMLVNAPCLNKVKSQNLLNVRLPNGATMESTHTASSDISELNKAASVAHISPGMENHSLLSV